MDIIDALAGAYRSEAEADGRIYGFLLGRVTDVTDPQGLGRVKARIGAQDAMDSTDWLMPAWPGSIEGKPRVGEYVLVAFLDGNAHKGIYFSTVTTRSQNRPSDFMVLGLQICGVLNALVDAFNGHVHSDPTSGFTGGPVSSGPHTPVSGVYAKDGNGTKVSSKSSDTNCLSREAKVR